MKNYSLFAEPYCVEKRERNSIKYLVIIAVCATFMFSGCFSPVNWQGNLDCGMSEKEIIDQSIQILMEEGFNITSQSNNFVIAMQEADMSALNKALNGYDTYIQWNIKVSNNKIIAIASLILEQTNVFGKKTSGSTTTLGENTHADHIKYWRVRRKLEKVCGNQMIIINTLENVGKEDDEFKK